MEAIILKCPDFGRYHFGTVAPDSDTALSQTSPCVYSDTLFSALIVLCNKAFPNEVENLVEYFKDGGVLISSGSYCLDILENNQFFDRIFFLPKPSHFDLLKEDADDRKTIKRIQYISKKIWEQGIKPSDRQENGCYIIDRKFLIHPEELKRDFGSAIEKIYSIIAEPKIADHARQKTNNIFFQTDLFLNTTTISSTDLEAIGYDGIGTITLRPHFYFLLKFEIENERLRNLIYLLLDLMVDDGIGGSISTGCGKIKEVEKVDWVLSPETKSNLQAVSASLISIQSESDLQGTIARNIIVRGGRKTANHGDLARIKMADTGALIQKGVKGQIENLHTTQPYLRYGMAFPLDIHSNYEYNDN